MSKKPNEDWQRGMLYTQGKNDLLLLDFHAEYKAMSEDERQRLRTWVEGVSAMDAPCTYISARVRVVIPQGDSAQFLDIEPTMLKKAIAEWDHGNFFTPTWKDNA